jgi:NAD(P)-dependent dehydrogenase (short-subunit alcohol dehydrogenase family)
MTINLTGKRALVTGGSSGIGRAIAAALAKAGARVAVTYLGHATSANELVAEVRKAGGDALAIKTEVSDPAGVTACFAELDRNWGGLDLLVNNAGIDGERGLGWEIDITAWRRVVEINLFGAFHCAQAALRRMVPQRHGVILNVSSVHEVIAWSGYSAYTTSKAGLAMLTKTLAQEAAPHGIRVLAIAPGAIRTPINRAVWSDPQAMKDLLKKIPLNRIGEADEVANLAVVLLSDIASYVTGGTVFVDGGMTDYPDFAHGG